MILVPDIIARLSCTSTNHFDGPRQVVNWNSFYPTVKFVLKRETRQKRRELELFAAGMFIRTTEHFQGETLRLKFSLMTLSHTQFFRSRFAKVNSQTSPPTYSIYS